MGEAIITVLNDILKVEGIEEAFSCFLVHRPGAEREKIVTWQHELTAALKSMTQDQMEVAIRQYLNVAAGSSHSRLELLMEILESLVRSGTVGARLVCEALITCEKLQHYNRTFWMETFKLLRRIIDLVEYKGVREIMKVY